MPDVDLHDHDENEKNTKIVGDELSEVQRQQKSGRKQPPYRITRNRRAVVVGRPSLRPRITVSSARRVLRR